MGHSNGKITAPVSIYDVQKTLGESSTDLGTLCRSLKINKWAKFKPVPIGMNFSVRINTDRINVVNPITGNNESVPAYYGAVNTKSGTVSGHSYQITELCGISIPEVLFNDDRAACDLIDDFTTNGLNWPAVGLKAGDVARLTDFENYDHQAEPPIYLSTLDEFLANENPYFSYSVNSESGYSLGIDDLVEYLHGYRFAVIVKTSSNSFDRILGEYIDAPAMSSGTIVWNTFPSNGTYKAYFVLVNEEKERIILLPHVPYQCENPVTFRVKYDTPSQNDPFIQLGIDVMSGKYGLFYKDYLLQEYNDIQEGDWIHLCTTGSLYLEFYLENRIESEQVISMSSVQVIGTFEFSNFSATYGPAFFVNGSRVSGTENISIAGGQKITFGILIQDIYYDSERQDTYPMKEGDIVGFGITIKNRNADVGSALVEVEYNTRYNGYFWSISKGYYNK